MNVDSQH